MKTCALYMTLYPHIRHQPLVFLTSHALYWWHHMHYIWHVIYCVWYHIHYMCDITQCLYLWHHTLYVYEISTLYGITHSVMTTQPLCNFTATMTDITPAFSVTSHALYITSHPILMSSHYCTYDITASIYETTSSVRATYTFNMSHHSHYLCHHTHSINKITPTLFMTSHSEYRKRHPVCGQHIHLICDITATLWVMTSTV